MEGAKPHMAGAVSFQPHIKADYLCDRIAALQLR